MKPREERGAADWTLTKRDAVELQNLLLNVVRGNEVVDLTLAILVWWSPSRMLYRVEFFAYSEKFEYVYTQEPTLVGVLWAIVKGLARG